LQSIMRFSQNLNFLILLKTTSKVSEEISQI